MANKQQNQQDNGEAAIGLGIPVGAAGIYFRAKGNKGLNQVNEYDALKNKADTLKNNINIRKNENQAKWDEVNKKLQNLNPESEEFKSVVQTLPKGDGELAVAEDVLKDTYNNINNHPVHSMENVDSHIRTMKRIKGRGNMLLAGGALLTGSGLATHFLNNKGNS